MAGGGGGGKGRKVLACEAVMSNINDIKNKIKIDNVQFFCAAFTKPEVANHKKEISFSYFPNLDGWSGIKRLPIIDSKEEEIILTVPTATVDQIIFESAANENKHISFIKSDVEAGDFDVLLGAEKTLRKYKPVVVFECSKQASADIYGYTKEKFFQYFRSLGYKLFQYSGEEFTEKDWDKANLYAEIWLIHEDSVFLSFFKNNYQNFAYTYVSQLAKLNM